MSMDICEELETRSATVHGSAASAMLSAGREIRTLRAELAKLVPSDAPMELPADLEKIAAEWDGCMFEDAPAGAVDIGAALRRSFAGVAPTVTGRAEYQPTNRQDAESGNVAAIKHVAYAEGYRDGKAFAAAELGAAVQAEPGAMVNPIYLGGPYHDGSFSVCELATGRVLRQFKTEVDLLGPQRYRWSHVGMERYRVMAASADDANADFVAAEPGAAVLTDSLHAALCQAVALLNRAPEVARWREGREAHDILRQALVVYADAAAASQP